MTRKALPFSTVAVSLSDAQHVITGIDKVHCAGDTTGQITTEIERRLADLFDGNIAAQRRPLGVLLEHVRKTTNGTRRGSLHGSGRNGVDADTERPQIV